MTQVDGLLSGPTQEAPGLGGRCLSANSVAEAASGVEIAEPFVYFHLQERWTSMRKTSKIPGLRGVHVVGEMSIRQGFCVSQPEVCSEEDLLAALE